MHQIHRAIGVPWNTSLDVLTYGKYYKPNAVIVDIKDDLPLVGQYIASMELKFYLMSNNFTLTYYESHYHAYTLQNDTAICTTFVFYEQLFIHMPIHIHKSEALCAYVILPYALCTM